MKTRAVSEAGGAEGIAGLVGGERTGGKGGGAKGVTGGRGAGADFSRLLAASAHALDDQRDNGGRGPRAEREPTESRGAGRSERRSRDVAGDVASSLVTQTRAEARAPQVGRDDEAGETARVGRRGRGDARGEIRADGNGEVRGSQRVNEQVTDQKIGQKIDPAGNHDGDDVRGAGEGATHVSRGLRDAGADGSPSLDERAPGVRRARAGEGNERGVQADGAGAGQVRAARIAPAPEASPAGPHATEGHDAGWSRGETDEVVTGAAPGGQPRGAAADVRAANEENVAAEVRVAQEENTAAETRGASGRGPRDGGDAGGVSVRAGKPASFASSGERGRATGASEPTPSGPTRGARTEEANVNGRESAEMGRAPKTGAQAGDGVRGDSRQAHALPPEPARTGADAPSAPHAGADPSSHGAETVAARAHTDNEAPAPRAETPRTDRAPAAIREAQGRKPALEAGAPRIDRPTPPSESGKPDTKGDHAASERSDAALAPAPRVQAKSDVAPEAPRARVPAPAPSPDVVGRREIDGAARGERRSPDAPAPARERREAVPAESGKATEVRPAPGVKPAVVRETASVSPARAEASKPVAEAPAPAAHPAHALAGTEAGDVDHAGHASHSKGAGPADGARAADHPRAVIGTAGAGGTRQNPDGQNQAPPRSAQTEAAPQAPAPRDLPRTRQAESPRPETARAREARAYEAHRPAAPPPPAAVPADKETNGAGKPAAEAPAPTPQAKRTPSASARTEAAPPVRDGGTGQPAGQAFRDESGSAKAMASAPAGDAPAPRKPPSGGSDTSGESGAFRRESATSPSPGEARRPAPAREERAFQADTAHALHQGAGAGEEKLPSKAAAPSSSPAERVAAPQPRSGETAPARAEAPAPRASGEAPVARVQAPQREASAARVQAPQREASARPDANGTPPGAHEGVASKPDAAGSNSGAGSTKRETAPLSETAPAAPGTAAEAHAPASRAPVIARTTPAPHAATPADGEEPAAKPAHASSAPEPRGNTRGGEKKGAAQGEGQGLPSPASSASASASSSESPPAPPGSSPPAASIARRTAPVAATDVGSTDAPDPSAAAQDAAATAARHDVIQQSAAAAQPAAPVPASEPEPEAEPRAKRSEITPAARPTRRLDDLDLAHAFGDRPTRDDDRGDDAGHRPRREAHLRDFDLIPGLAPQPAAPLAAGAQVKPGSLAPAEAHAAAVAAKVATGAAGATGDDAASEGREAEASATLPTRAGLEALQQPLPVPFPQVAPLPVDGAQAPAPTSAPLPPPLPPELAGLPEDPGLSLSIMSQAAHLTIANDDGNALELHLRLLPEGADIRATGELAPLVHSRASELGHVLAAEGVTLGRFELGSGDRQGDQARRDNPTFERDTMDRTPNRSPSSARSTSEGDGVPSPRDPRGRSSRIHVKA